MEQRTFSEAQTNRKPVPPPTATKPVLRSKSTSTGIGMGTRKQKSVDSIMSSASSLTRSYTEDSTFRDNSLREDPLEDSLSMPSLSGVGECPKHTHERLKYYCQFHGELVCADCLAMDAKHQGHKHIRAEEMVKDYRSGLRAQILPVQELHENAETALKAMDQRKKKLLDNGTDVKGAIKSYVAKLTSLLEMREATMLEEAEKIMSQKIKQHNAHQTYLENVIEEMAHVVDAASQVANDNSNNILYSYKELSEWVLESTRKFQSLPKEVFQPLQGPNVSFIPDHSAEEVCQIIGTISERQADPTQSFFDEATTKGLTVNKEATVQLIINDGDGRPYTNHVPGIKVEVISTKTNGLLDLTFQQDKTTKNQYNIEFTPREGCEHIIKARIGSYPVQNSPMVVNVSTIIQGEIIGDIKGLLQPYGITITEQKDVVVVENGKDCVSIFNQDGKTMKHRVITGKGNKKLARPRGVVILPSNYLLISDDEGLKHCTMEGKHMTVIGKQGTGELEFSTPSGMVTSRDGKIFVCDTFNNRIQILEPDLSFHGYMGNNLGPQESIHAPYDIAVNSLGMFYIADYSTHVIKIFSKRGEFLGQIASKENGEPLKNPVSVHVNKNDHVFVGEDRGTGISVFDTNGKFLMTVPIKLAGSYGISSDEEGHIYICDRANRRVIIYK